MRKNLMLTSLAIMVAMSEQGYNHTPEKRTKNANIIKEPKEIKPNGLKEYFFTESGHFFNSMPTGSYTILYKCFALNDKNAKRKFNSFRKRNREQ